MAQNIQDLEKWNRDLREEIETLKQQIKVICGEGDSNNKLHHIKLTPSVERILRLLLIREFVPYEAIDTILSWDKLDIPSAECVKVYVSVLRRKLPFLKGGLINKPTRGYYLTKEARHRLMFELQFPGVTPLGENGHA
jgi:hypothetical protein